MNKEYEFTLIPSGIDPKRPGSYTFGKGTLEDGLRLVKKMDKQFVSWGEKPGAHSTFPALYLVELLFDLPKPSDEIPIFVWEGADLYASGKYVKEKGIYKEEYYYTMDNKWELWDCLPESRTHVNPLITQILRLHLNTPKE